MLRQKNSVVYLFNSQCANTELCTNFMIRTVFARIQAELILEHINILSAVINISNRPMNARGMVIFSQVRLQTLRPELGDATARATVRAFVPTDRPEAASTQTQHKPPGEQLQQHRILHRILQQKIIQKCTENKMARNTITANHVVISSSSSSQ